MRKLGIMWPTIVAAAFVWIAAESSARAAPICNEQITVVAQTQTASTCAQAFGSPFFLVNSAPGSGPNLSYAAVDEGNNLVKLKAQSFGPLTSSATGTIDTQIAAIPLISGTTSVAGGLTYAVSGINFNATNAQLVVTGSDQVTYSFPSLLAASQGTSSISYTVQAAISGAPLVAQFTDTCPFDATQVVPVCVPALVNAPTKSGNDYTVNLPFALTIPISSLFVPGTTTPSGSPFLSLDLTFGGTVTATGALGGCSLLENLLGIFSCYGAYIDASDPLQINALAVVDSFGNPIPFFSFTDSTGFVFPSPSTTTTTVPEPGSVTLLAFAVLGLLGWRCGFGVREPVLERHPLALEYGERRPDFMRPR